MDKMMQKHKKIRLTGKSLRELNEKIYTRDNQCCIICETWIEEGVKCHHVIYKSHGGEDVEENGVMLCLRCHHELHSGKESQEYKDYCTKYLRGLYGAMD